MLNSNDDVLFSDPAKDKQRIKQQIADAIGKYNPGVNKAEIWRAVDEHYEDMLRHAAVKQHIPSLIENELRREFRLRG